MTKVNESIFIDVKEYIYLHTSAMEWETVYPILDRILSYLRYLDRLKREKEWEIWHTVYMSNLNE